MMLDDKIFQVTSDATIRQLSEALKMLIAIKSLK
jgi:hypothetical protein